MPRVGCSEGQEMAMGVRSIRTKFLLLVAGVATVVGGVSVVYDLWASQWLLREQMVKRGRYIASNLAFNSKYGVLTEDKPLLTQFLEGAVAAGGGATGSDVVGALIRDAKGQILAQTGKSIKDLPPAPASAIEELNAFTTDGEGILLFRAPVTSTSAGGSGGMAAELGLAAPAEDKKGESQKGGVEVAITKAVMEA